MNDEEYDNLARVERTHWYYSGKREFVRSWIERVRPPVRSDTLLDCGAGTGLFAEEMQASCRVLVVDDHEAALRMLRRRFASDQVIALAGDSIPLPDHSVEFVTALDVLEHTPDDAAVVRGFHRILRPGGVAVITVPASKALRSDWDEVLHHYRRYDRPGLRALFPDEQWDMRHLNYTNVAVYPIVWLVRRWRRWFPADPKAVRAEDQEPPRWLNFLLRYVMVKMAGWRLPFPCGVSLLAVVVRR